MNIDWEAITPVSSFSGGLLIGLAAALMVLLRGKVMGISGIIAALPTLPAMPSLLSGHGLLLSGMSNTAKVQSFLDIFGRWAPSLGLVMGGAIAIGLVVFSWAKRRQTSLLGKSMDLPKNTRIDRQLMVGLALFGVGWGLAGFCPGPAVISLSTGNLEVIWFVGAMLMGMVSQQTVAQRS